MHDSNPEVSPRLESPFSIGAVAQITGIPEATLRVWERRYHFPQAMRTPGRQRQYSQREALRLQWVKMRMDEGMRASKAIRACHLMDRNSAIAATLHEPLTAHKAQDPGLLAVRSALLAALLAYDSARASQILNEATLAHPLEDIVLQVIGPTLSAIGESWSAGEIEVATEHFASNFLRHQSLMWMRASPPPYQDARSIVLACAPEELHEGSLLMLGVLLRQLRWPVLYLGQSLPLTDLPALADHVSPALVVFVAMSEPAAQALSNWPRWLVHETETKLPIIGYGGRAFTENPALVGLVPGAYLGETIYEGCQRIHRLMLNITVLQD